MEKGFTLLELIFVVLIISVLSLIGSSQYKKHQAKINKKQNQIYCIEGYKFYKDKQVVDSEGKGIPCGI